MAKKTNRNPKTIHGNQRYGYQVVVSENLEWVCCCGQGHQEAKSPETKEQMHRGSAPDPERPVRGAPRGNPGKPLR